MVRFLIMGLGREAAEEIKRAEAAREQKEADTAVRAAKLAAGIPPFWDQLKEALAAELQDFKTGMGSRADQLKGDLANPNNFTVYSSGLKLLEVVFVQPEVVRCFLRDGDRETRTEMDFGYHGAQMGVRLGEHRSAPAQAAHEILQQVYNLLYPRQGV